MKQRLKNVVVGTATAPLLYWLAVISGLAGLTIFRIDDIDRVVPIWFGSIVGVAIGQLLGVLRVRVWTISAFAFAMCWFLGPAAYFTLVAMFGPGVASEVAFMAIVPAFVCGYASLTERGGLLAFWYPAMLWMLVILEGEAPGSFAPRGSLPLILGLAALFIGFLRARETRRVALWKAYATVGLATPAPRMVLRGSPVRGFAQMIWTASIGGGALLLAGWIAPKLWEKDRELHHRATLVANLPPPAPRLAGDGLPCCPEDHYWEREQIREYMPLRSSREEARIRKQESDLTLTCSYCAPAPSAEQVWYSQGPGVGLRAMDTRTVYGDDIWPREIGYYGVGTSPYNTPTYGSGSAYYSNNIYDPTPGIATGYPLPAYTAPPKVEPAPPPPPPPPPVAQKKSKKGPHVFVGTGQAGLPAAATAKPNLDPPGIQPSAPVQSKPAVVATPALPKPQAAPPVDPRPQATAKPEPSMPWGWLFPLFAGALAFPVISRFTRRQITLRHLTRPFWKEPVDQRISNHWQRMLVGLRDAGIQMRKNEQPQAFAKRVGIAGMEECAGILERVRHGVRIEDEDLGTMNESADAVVRASHGCAGMTGRVAAAFRWPLV